MPLGCRPTAMVFTCLHRPGSGASTETLPWLAIPVFRSMRTGVPEEVACGSLSLGRSPPQLLTYTRSSRAATTVYGATPTATLCSASPALRLTSCTALPRDEQTQSASADRRAIPVGNGSPPTFGGIIAIALVQA